MATILKDIARFPKPDRFKRLEAFLGRGLFSEADAARHKRDAALLAPLFRADFVKVGRKVA